MQFYVALGVGVVSLVVYECIDFAAGVHTPGFNLILAFLTFGFTLALLWTGEEGDD